MKSELTDRRRFEWHRGSAMQCQPPLHLFLLLLLHGFCLEQGRRWYELQDPLRACATLPGCRPPSQQLLPCLCMISRILSPPPEPGRAERSCIHGEGHMWAPVPPSELRPITPAVSLNTHT